MHRWDTVLDRDSGDIEGHGAQVEVVLGDQLGVDQTIVPEQFDLVGDVHGRVSGDQHLDRHVGVGHIGPANPAIALGDGNARGR
ncbi:hypothetical protein D3C77_526320 [compost metagenome]